MTMTRKDKWIAGLSFIFILLFMAFLLFGSIQLAMVYNNKWVLLLVPVSMGINMVLTVLIMPYMWTWQEWANNVKKLVKRK